MEAMDQYLSNCREFLGDDFGEVNQWIDTSQCYDFHSDPRSVSAATSPGVVARAPYPVLRDGIELLQRQIRGVSSR